MKKLLCALALMAGTAAASAEVFETVVLNNGNEYKGFITEQLANGNITIWADTSVVDLQAKAVERIVHRGQRADIYLSGFSFVSPNAAVVEAVKESFGYADSAATAVDSVVWVSTPAVKETVYSPSHTGRVISDIEILEEGDVIRYRDTHAGSIDTKMAEVAEIQRTIRPDKQLNGMNDEIVTKNGATFRGQILSIVPRRYTKLRTATGSVRNISPADIAVMRRVAVDTESPVDVQSMLLDNVHMKNGDVLEGVIVEQDYSRGTFDLIDSERVISRRNLRDITGMRKSINPAYAPVYEFEFAPDTIYLNRKVYGFTSYDRKKDGTCTAAVSRADIHRIKRGKHGLTLEYKSPMDAILVLMRVDVINGEIKFSDVDLINRQVRPHSSSVGSNGVERIVYNLPDSGTIYALVNAKDKKMLVFVMKK